MCGLSGGGGTPSGLWGGGTPAGPSRGGGGPTPCSLPGGCTSVFTSGGGGSTSMFTSGGSTSVFTSGGVPCDLSHNAIIYCYRMPQCIMGKIYMEPPPHKELDRLTDRQTLVKTLPSRTTWRAVTRLKTIRRKFDLHGST